MDEPYISKEDRALLKEFEVSEEPIVSGPELEDIDEVFWKLKGAETLRMLEKEAIATLKDIFIPHNKEDK